ncbi:cytochrome c oxidase, coo3-type, subunit III [Syntrophotalea carbinolica DSM 2380]|uniref:Cytochrome c oxidase, coo3-type, subunit III n=1 Tax=Syntrophotalea carbinolica (strain DSM 2380 / NBRC 103641 / GraBd1) TaxID=338963 RepID=Q3A1J2_SYNC1|nr:cytochrome c oxidase subunit 3 [Syntrophotalea carbinolica]ABA89765.1 cytochrome c oxidase, coo3-type, subunit III [Syntrophotalea carbinolica DSM 2380]
MNTSAQHHDAEGARLGMWLFLLSELLLFGGLFVLFAVYLQRYPDQFIAGGKQLSLAFGAGNTALLLTSSLTVALALEALRRNRYRLCQWLLGSTIGAALWFLVNKGLEWHAKFEHDLYPGSVTLRQAPPGHDTFFGLYYLTTGLHGLHVIIGGVILAWVLCLVRQGRITGTSPTILENSALYWHLVDVIWIFIFPLYYLLL